MSSDAETFAKGVTLVNRLLEHDPFIAKVLREYLKSCRASDLFDIFEHGMEEALQAPLAQR